MSLSGQVFLDIEDDTAYMWSIPGETAWIEARADALECLERRPAFAACTHTRRTSGCTRFESVHLFALEVEMFEINGAERVDYTHLAGRPAFVSVVLDK
jgi:hypothetical protein